MSNDTLDNIRNHLKTLRLKRINDVLDQELAAAQKQNRSTTQVLERLLEIEAVSLIERRIERRIKESKLPSVSFWPILTLSSRPVLIKSRSWSLQPLALSSANSG